MGEPGGLPSMGLHRLERHSSNSSSRPGASLPSMGQCPETFLIVMTGEGKEVAVGISKFDCWVKKIP